ncbi:MAG: protein kinase [Proteobacteria bacterium]|nr:protein kinase [Pseudomonadota bacterium]
MNLPIQQITGANEHPEHVGQFKIVGQLGKGAQSVVYLAQDPQLQRQVAIKTLDRRHRDYTHLLHEARNVSKLKHPNIIPIYEIGVHEDMPYLAYQFCEGQSLRNVLKSKGKFKTLEAVNIIRHVLDAMAYAHRSGIVHRDLNPANIMLDNNNAPRIMDFGISIMMGTLSPTSAVAGTVNYMAPEQIANNEIGPSVDIFAIGLMLYEMLTGHQVFSADHSRAITYKIIHENVTPPSSREASIEAQLDEIVMQALEKDPAKRYAKASEMKADLDIYAKPVDGSEDSAEGDGRNSTVQFLLRRMKRKQDFPAISANISQINKKTSNHDSSSAAELSNVILKDYALTTKLLRLVNTSFYGQFGGEITTVTRAVVILGFEQVRAATLSIILFEHLNNPSQAKELKGAACRALMSGIIAREQAKKMPHIKADDIETVFIASMFHKLGRLLTIYYLSEEYGEIKNLIVNKSITEQQAVLSVLGASYEELGKGIAHDWKLPDVMIQSMKRIPNGPVTAAKSSSESICQLASFANELCEIGTGNEDYKQKLEEISSQYKKALGLTVKDIKNLIEHSKTEIKEYTGILNIDIADVTPFATKENAGKGNDISITTTKVDVDRKDDNSFAATRDLSNPARDETVTAIDENDAIPTEAKDQCSDIKNEAAGEITSAQPQTHEDAEPVAAQQLAAAENANEHQDILVHGIAEITEAMLGEYNLNDVLTMVLETIYRGMGFTRVLFCINDRKNKMILGRFGFGKNIDEIIPKFRCKINNEDDIFNNAVRDKKEVILLDANSAAHKHQVPKWLRELALPCSVVAYPLIINKRCIGLIYADTDDHLTIISTETLKFFKILRSQAALAIQQKQIKQYSTKPDHF